MAGTSAGAKKGWANRKRGGGMKVASKVGKKKGKVIVGRSLNDYYARGAHKGNFRTVGPF